MVFIFQERDFKAFTRIRQKISQRLIPHTVYSTQTTHNDATDSNYIMTEPDVSYKPRFLQKVALVVGKLCFLIAVGSGVFLYLKIDELGADHPVSASFLASVFFFTFVGILLSIVGRADIPDLTIRPENNKGDGNSTP